MIYQRNFSDDQPPNSPLSYNATKAIRFILCAELLLMQEIIYYAINTLGWNLS